MRLLVPTCHGCLIPIVLLVMTTASLFHPSSALLLPDRSSHRTSPFPGRFLANRYRRSSPLPRCYALPPQTPDVAKEGIEDIVNFLDVINHRLEETFHSTLKQVLDTVFHSANDVQVVFKEIEASWADNIVVDPSILAKLQDVTDEVNGAIHDLVFVQYPALQPAYELIQSQLRTVFSGHLLGLSSSLPTPVALLLSSIVTYTAVSSLLRLGQPPLPLNPYPLKRYDADAARAYFDGQFPMVLKRGIEIATASLGFGLKLLKDYINNDLTTKADERAVELATLLTTLGPSFIKIGQSLSIRTDLLSPAYVRGLKTLQDQVPPFDTAIAKQILQDEWGASTESILIDMSSEPVAAASLGQVYKARLRSTGQQVAIKVLRPNIEGKIALDMHILRELAPIVKRIFNLNTDLVGVVDTWGTGFVDELDYVSEAKNAQEFMKGIQGTELKDVVFAPPIVEELSTRKVLTTEWVDGERLDRSNKDDVTVLCSVAMNTYLTMMLELGTLHSDPHPGNLLRTPEGRLCILDWGMVTKLDNDLQLTLITHMAHLTSRDYAEIPRDLLLLGFIPQDKADLIDDSGIVEVLADIYGAWSSGGGAAAINVNKVIAQLQDLTAEKGNLFQIPPYFAYIAKCFSVLEGIGLSNDPQYSIINECLPYVSKRLLTDKNARTGAALSTFIFGPDKYNIDTRLVDYRRVEQLVEGFSSYSTSSSGALLGKSNLTRTELLEASAEQVLDLIFAEEETPLQSILIEQVAKIIGAGSRSIWAEILGASGTLPSGRTVLGTFIDPLGIWRTSPLVRVNKMDTMTIETTQKLVSLMQSQARISGTRVLDLSTVSREEAVELATILGRKIWERRNGVVKTSNRLATQLLRITAKKLETGERDITSIPVARKVETTHRAIAETTTHGTTSQRLLNARERMKALESGNMADEPMDEIIIIESNV